MERSKLNKILSNHKLWLETNGVEGKKADLSYTDLSYADLRSADLRSANLDFSAFPLWCGGLSVHIDDKQAKQLLYHLVQNVQYSKNTSKTLKKLLLNKTILKMANEFHRIGKNNIKEIKEE